MNTDFSVIQLIWNASLAVQLVIFSLLAVSVFSWGAILNKVLVLRQVEKLNKEFERRFWSGTSLTDLLKETMEKPSQTGPMERIFANGFRELQKLQEKQDLTNGMRLEGSYRAMRASFQREVDSIEKSLSWLASVGSVAPYVGLFGTVWGIMHAFTGFATVQQLTLTTVAPAIAEALVATGMGLFAAIPAVLAYNHFTNQTDCIANGLENFIDEFSNLLQRSLA